MCNNGVAISQVKFIGIGQYDADLVDLRFDMLVMLQQNNQLLKHNLNRIYEKITPRIEIESFKYVYADRIKHARSICVSGLTVCMLELN